MGVEQAKLVREHLGIKPYQGQSQAVVLISAQNLTPEAQNALLKTLEEPPSSSIVILGSPGEDQLLPTVVSRCYVSTLETQDVEEIENQGDIQKLLEKSIETRFQFIEKVTDKDGLLKSLILFFRQRTLKQPTQEDNDFLKDLIEAQRWIEQNVNPRAILEYLMLKLPRE